MGEDTRRVENMDLKVKWRFTLEVEIWELRLWGVFRPSPRVGGIREDMNADAP